ncbi:hypothetical protein EVAR_83660_1 [Eumeta japonica]|uniref:Uncharacterized protein n=1 Tax=Eumeta variegata TaxID=151549 RepID=A0A4C1UNW5_EUMVA|nr:hypothetical protein EVAR_83660_1 [Eumeta japonica]
MTSRRARGGRGAARPAAEGAGRYCVDTLRLGVTLKSVTLGNVTMSHRTREAANALRLSHSTMIGLPRAALENYA